MNNKCISVVLSDGKVVSVNAGDGIDQLSAEDIQAIEDYINFIKKRVQGEQDDK